MKKKVNSPQHSLHADKDSVNGSSQPPAFKKEQIKAVSFLKRKLKNAQRRLLERQQILNDCQNWFALMHLGQLLQANLFQVKKGMEAITVADWEQNGQDCKIILDPLLKPHEQVAQYFKRSRKFRAGEPHAKRMLLMAEEEVRLFTKQLEKIEGVKDLPELHDLCTQFKIPLEKQIRPQALLEKAPPKPYRCYISQTGLQIWVGKSAKDNDALTFHYANGSDWWLHARDVPGSHVVVRCARDTEPDQESLKDAMELALRYSKLKDKGEGEVVVSQVKWLKRMKSAPGKVMLSKHKVMYARLDESRWQRLKSMKNDHLH